MVINGAPCAAASGDVLLDQGAVGGTGVVRADGPRVAVGRGRDAAQAVVRTRLGVGTTVQWPAESFSMSVLWFCTFGWLSADQPAAHAVFPRLAAA